MIQSNNASFTTQLILGQQVLLLSATDSYSQMCNVVNIVNASYIILGSNINFACTNINIYQPNIYGNCYIGTVNSLSDLYVTNATSTIQANSYLIGSVSQSFGQVNSIAINDVTKTTNTFVQLNKYSITMLSGSFIQNETVAQANVSGLYHSGDNLSYVYLSNLNGKIGLSGVNLIGQQSGAIAQITKIYSQELVFNSGEILYIENLSPVLRQNNQIEAFSLAFSF